jgi:transcriptional regulator with XRE-family HTH domain
MQVVGILLLELRKEKGMTQKNIADAMNISDKTLSTNVWW